MADLIVALAYVAKEGHQMYDEISVAAGTTIAQAIKMSGWLDAPLLQDFALWYAQNQHTQPNHKSWYVGIYSQKKSLDTPLCDGDRIEIYRALNDDPMAKRKQKSKSRMKSKSAKM